MASFFSHGFASGGDSSKKGKKKTKEEGKQGVWLQVVDGNGYMNWQHSITGAYWRHYIPAPMHHHPHPHMVPAVVQAMPVAQHVYPAQANHWGGVHVVPVSPVDGKKKEKKKEKGGGYWDSIRDEDGVRCFKHSRTNKIRYTDPYV